MTARRWTAEVFVNSQVGRIPVEVYASTFQGAEQQIYAKHGNVQQITNLRERSRGGSDGGGGLDAGSTTGAIILGGGLLGFLMFTPWVMMGVGGAAGTWIAQKVTGYSVEEFTEDKNPSEGDQKKAVAIFCTAVLLGGMGFVWGDNFKKGIEAEMNTSSIATEVRKA